MQFLIISKEDFDLLLENLPKVSRIKQTYPAVLSVLPEHTHTLTYTPEDCTCDLVTYKTTTQGRQQGREHVRWCYGSRAVDLSEDEHPIVRSH